MANLFSTSIVARPDGGQGGRYRLYWFYVKQRDRLDGIKIAEDKLRQIAFTQGYLYAIITNDEKYRIWEVKDGPQGAYHDITLSELIDKFETIKPHIDDVENKKPHAADFCTEVHRLVDECLSEDAERNKKVKDFVASCKDSDFLVKGGKLCFSDIKKENEFFEQLIETFEGDTVYPIHHSTPYF